MKHHTFILGFLAALSLAARAGAADIYVAQTAQGANTGADAADAHSLAWFNTASEWGGGTGTIRPGDTVHLCGALTSQLAVQKSGSPGAPITLFFEPGAVLTQPAGSYSGFIFVNAMNWITIDGGVNGTIMCTQNGTGLAYQQQAAGIYVGNSSQVTIQNLTVTNLYLISGADPNEYGEGVYVRGVVTNITVRNCQFYNSDEGVIFIYAAGVSSNMVVAGNTMIGCNHSIEMEADNNAQSQNVQVYKNTIKNSSNWDARWNNVSGWHHLDGMILSTTPPNTNNMCNGLLLYDNVVADIGTNTTAWVYIEGSHTNAVIYNNIFSAVAPFTTGYAFLTGGGGGAKIYNNTCVSWGKNCFFYGVDTNYDIRNNLVSSCSGIYVTGSISISDNNLLYNCGNNPTSYPPKGLLTIPVWLTLGFDTHSILTNPQLVNPAGHDFHLTSTSPAIGAGAALGAIVTTDFDGNPRPLGTSCDIGAYQWTAAGSPPPPPQGLHVIGSQ